MNSQRIITIGSVALALTVAVTALRPWHRCLGTTEQERGETLPGDDFVPAPRYQTTRAVAITATAATIWPWLIQLGQGRGGFYTFDKLENLMGLKIHSANRIVPEFQQLALGDVVPLSAYGGPTAEVIEPNSALVLHLVIDPFTGRPLERGASPGRRWFDWTWAFTLQPVDDAHTRLVIRTRANYAPPLVIAPLVAVLVEPAHMIMEWGMLRGIKQRAESMLTSGRVGQ